MFVIADKGRFNVLTVCRSRMVSCVLGAEQ